MKLKAICTVFSLVAIGLLLNAGYEEWTGEAVASSGRGIVEKADKTTQPVEFRNLMTYQWIMSGIWAAVATFLWQIVRKHDSLDVFAPDRPGASSRQKE